MSRVEPARLGLAVTGCSTICEQAIDEQIVLEQAAATAPAKLAQRAIVDRAFRRLASVDRPFRGLASVDREIGLHQTARLTISSLILPMARVGLRFFGHTSTQFMIV